MKYIALGAALDMLPRYKAAGNGGWDVDGSRLMTNAKVTPRAIDRLLVKIIHRYDAASMVPVVQMVDVTGKNVWVIHRHLRVRSLMWLYAHLNSFQKMPIKKLPIYLFYKGRIIVWNGTHRMTLGRLMRKKIRARVIDIDKFLRDERKGLVRKFVRRIKVRPKKKGKRRGKAKH